MNFSFFFVAFSTLLFSVLVASQDCPADLPQRNCTRNPCNRARCSRFPDAICTNDSCGGCYAVFTSAALGGIVPKFACHRNSTWPECVDGISCPNFTCAGGCPRVSDAVCNVNCNCRRTFTDRRTGNVLTAFQCGTRFFRQCPPITVYQNSSCAATTCPRRCPRGQICCPTDCRGSSSCVPRPERPMMCRIPDESNLRVFCRKGRRVNSTCRVRCPSGFELMRKGRLTKCTPEGFRPRLNRFKCARTSCPRISRPNLIARCPKGNRNRTACRLSCRRGYRLRGPRTVRCRNGRYIPSPRRTRCIGG